MYSVHPKQKRSHAFRVNFLLHMAMICQSSGFKPIDLYNIIRSQIIISSGAIVHLERKSYRDPLTNQIPSERGNVFHCRETGVHILQLAASEHGVHMGTYIQTFYHQHRNLKLISVGKWYSKISEDLKLQWSALLNPWNAAPTKLPRPFSSFNDRVEQLQSIP